MIFCLAVITGCQQVSTQSSNNLAKNTKAASSTPSGHEGESDAKRISLKEAKDAYDAGTALIVDTRSADAYNSERIKSSINIPYGDLEKRIDELSKDKQIIFYCS
jgi:3-mercaptopyruvate sulfurtransferase SseA